MLVCFCLFSLVFCVRIHIRSGTMRACTSTPNLTLDSRKKAAVYHHLNKIPSSIPLTPPSIPPMLPQPPLATPPLTAPVPNLPILPSSHVQALSYPLKGSRWVSSAPFYAFIYSPGIGCGRCAMDGRRAEARFGVLYLTWEW